MVILVFMTVNGNKMAESTQSVLKCKRVLIVFRELSKSYSSSNPLYDCSISNNRTFIVQEAPSEEREHGSGRSTLIYCHFTHFIYFYAPFKRLLVVLFLHLESSMISLFLIQMIFFLFVKCYQLYHLFVTCILI